MKIAIIGATGLVGQTMMHVFGKSSLVIESLIPVASEKSIGKQIVFRDKNISVTGLQQAVLLRPEIAVFSAGSAISKEWAPKFASVGATVIDNSSAWRMDTDIPLIVPSVNGEILRASKSKIIANPNCSTIQLVMVLAPLYRQFGLKRVIVSTYQSVTGTGINAVKQLTDERQGIDGQKAYPHAIDLNVIPHGGYFESSGYTSEEMKLVNETRKILNNNTIPVSATVVRVPVFGGHSESVNISMEKPFNIEQIKTVLSNTPAVKILDNPLQNLYPMPISSQNTDEVHVGRIRTDNSYPNSLNMWVVADNLRIGAATNALWITEYLINNKLVEELN